MRINPPRSHLVFACVTAASCAIASWSVGAADRVSARSLEEVGVIRVDAENCDGMIGDALHRRGFAAVPEYDRERVDAVLDVSIRNEDDHRYLEGGNAVLYMATLRGRNGRVLFKQSGVEQSDSVREICMNIGREIARQLEYVPPT
jgi:hypothetical protein